MNDLAARRRKWLGLAGWLLLSAGAIAAGVLLTAVSVRGWYVQLHKPSWTPPNSIFPPVWTTLYALMALSAWRVWLKSGFSLPIWIYLIQLCFNVIWSGLFFSLQRPDLGLIDISLLWVAIVAMVISFAKVDRAAALMQIPYWLWVSYAWALNLAIWRLNPVP